MSKTWYPVIDYELCMECNACFDKCTHGVYKQSESSPVVINPEGCVHGCHGCGNLCPASAIKYVGDTTEAETEVGCGCGSSCSNNNTNCCG